ncbi:hypothetical protein [Erwinia oleae]|uniref:hypothetical protein n=1 Tax=Erwinia oleae TaxID=796334 RepID=UPI000690CB15|nr:hypothetical protein [Erwinia oleae]
MFGNNSKNFSYQSENHPLSGSDKGGKLKEIELRSLQDFATLNLACLAKGVQIPSGTLIRLNPTPREKQDNNLKARYLNPQQSAGFQQKLAAMLKDENIEIQGASLTDLQRINQDLRGRDLAVLL